MKLYSYKNFGDFIIKFCVMHLIGFLIYIFSGSGEGSAGWTAADIYLLTVGILSALMIFGYIFDLIWKKVVKNEIGI